MGDGIERQLLMKRLIALELVSLFLDEHQRLGPATAASNLERQMRSRMLWEPDTDRQFINTLSSEEKPPADLLFSFIDRYEHDPC